MSLRPIMALLLLGLAAPAATAQTMDEIIAKHLEARGGDKWKAVKTMRLTGKMMMGPGMEAPFTMEMARPNQWRLDFIVQGMTGTQAYDGAAAWMSMPFQGKKDPELMPEDATKEMADQADFDGPLVDYKAKGHTVELLGKESVDGADAYKLKVTLKSGSVRTMFIDAETFLEMKTEQKRTMRGQEFEGVSTVGDYKDVEGLMIAHSMEQGAKGSTQTQKLVLDKVEVNPSFAEGRFAMPAKADSTAAPADSAKMAAESKAGKDAAKGAAGTAKDAAGKAKAATKTKDTKAKTAGKN